MKKLGILITSMLLAVCLCGCSVNVGAVANPEKYTAGDADITEKVGSIIIEWPSGKVELIKADTEAVQIREICDRELPKDEQMHWWLDGTTLRIRYDLKFGWNIVSGLAEKELTVTIPRGLDLDRLEIGVASADVTVADPVSAKVVDIDSASGEININIAAAEEITLDTASGRMNVEVGSAGSFDADAASGSLHLNAGEIDTFDADFASGKVSAAFVKAPSRIDVDTSSGDVELTLPGDAQFTLDYDTASGDFDSDFPVKTSDGKYITGSGEASYNVDTASGDLSILINGSAS